MFFNYYRQGPFPPFNPFGPMSPGGPMPGQGPQRPPSSQGGQGPDGPPKQGPPQYIPQKSDMKTKGQPSYKAVDPGSIRGCKYRYVYIWLDNGEEFWMWLTYVGRRSIAGWRFVGYGPWGPIWRYFGIDTRKIDSFVCV